MRRCGIALSLAPFLACAGASGAHETAAAPAPPWETASYGEAYAEPAAESYAESEAVSLASEAPSAMASMDAPASAPRAQARPQQRSAPPPPPQGPKNGNAAPAPERVDPQRLVQYSGNLGLLVRNVPAAQASARTHVEEAGGFVEAMNDNYFAARVPRDAFFSTLQKLELLGDVQSRAINAQDVTAAYVELELRLGLLEKSRERLIALLALAKSEHEKLSILREVKRLTEEIDQLTAQMKGMRSLADFSRITVHLAPRAQPVPGGFEVLALRWVRSLTPFSRDLAARGERFQLTVPKAMVALGTRDYFTAEAADGAVVWASRQKNEPQGDTAFWLEVVKARLTQTYAEVQEEAEANGFRVLTLRPHAPERFVYQIALRAQDDDLELVETYYPTAQLAGAHAEAVRAALLVGEEP